MSNRLQERAPIGLVQGRDVMITPEWFRNLSELADSISASTTGVTAAQIAAIAQIAGLSTSLATLTAQLVVLTARVDALDGGFQS